MNKIKFNNKINDKYITTEGKSGWNNRSCAVVSHIIAQKVIDDEIKTFYIIGKRGQGGDNKGLLNVPCGYMDWNENLENTSKREIYEESGFIIDNYIDKAAINFMEQPWYVNTEPTENRQNIVLHTAFVFVLNSDEELPELHLDNMEENEVESIQWMDVDDILNSDENIWAFNHKEKVKQFMTYLQELIDFETMVTI